MGDALGQLARVDEDQRAAMLVDELHQPLVDLGPVLVRAHGLQLPRRHLDGQVHVAEVADVHHGGRRRLGPDQEPGEFIERLLRGRQADADRPGRTQGVQAFQGEREVGAALVPGHGVNLIDDDGLDAGAGSPGSSCR